MNPKTTTKTATVILTTILLLLLPKPIYAQKQADFIINTYTRIHYTTGQDFVTVVNNYEKKVENSIFYLTREGEKVFHIPDLEKDTENIEKERKFKEDSLTVTDTNKNPIKYSVKQLAIGQGMYVHVPHYRETTKAMPYSITMTYKTHDNIVKAGDLVTLIGSAISESTQNEKGDAKSGTTTSLNYYFSFVVDKNIPLLAKAYPRFTKQKEDGLTYYNFSTEDRKAASPTLEFGTEVIYRFELEYKTPKTDTLIPEEYSGLFKALSTNIYEMSLPREYSETNQEVWIDTISPTPKNIFRNREGNVMATFEVPSNKDGAIKVSGYIKQNKRGYPESHVQKLNINFKDYLEKINQDKGNIKYLTATKYWEIGDPFIQEAAESLLEGKNTLFEVVDADYEYVNEKLTYDEEKANSENTRIGAANALSGGASVCMEYADSMIALLRAQGIPARAALGYANIRDTERIQVRHQWVQIWIPDHGWFSIDPTFESKNRKMGQMIDRVLWETFYDDSLSNISIFSINDEENFSEDNYKVEIFAVNNMPETDIKKYNEIVPEKDIESEKRYNMVTKSNSFFKTTVLGRALLVTAPVIILIIFVTTLVALFRKITNRNKE
ncbi:transglutaminase domain-containing protein [Candidatus Dojkabacteria bacterium]|nr:transglutaminase domain-containing protein [Candidatus Dojkabacteria bacterium]